MKDFLGNNKFAFTFSGKRFENNEFQPMIQSINIPGVNSGVLNLGTSIRQLPYPGDSLEYDELTAEFVVREDLRDWETIFNWLNDIRDPRNSKIEFIFSDASLVLLTNKNNPNLIIELENIFPITLGPVQMNTNTDDSEVLTCQVSFKFHAMKLIRSV